MCRAWWSLSRWLLSQSLVPKRRPNLGLARGCSGGLPEEAWLDRDQREDKELAHEGRGEDIPRRGGGLGQSGKEEVRA